MSIFSKKLVKQAAKRNRSKIALPSRVITTNDFGFSLPIFAREVIPGDRWKINIKSFTRLAPMPVPTYGDFRQVNRCFYVRFSNVWKPWADYFANRPYYDDSGTPHTFNKVPTILNTQLVQMFTGLGQWTKDSVTKFAYVVGTDYNSTLVDKCDFEIQDKINGTNHRYQWNLTNLGRRLYTTLLNLGYKINFTNYFVGSGYQYDTTEFSLLPLLCYVRAYYDYYLPSKYTNTSSLRKYFEIIDWNDLVTQFTSLVQLFDDIANTLFANFDSDYFTSSWLTP